MTKLVPPLLTAASIYHALRSSCAETDSNFKLRRQNEAVRSDGRDSRGLPETCERRVWRIRPHLAKKRPHLAKKREIGEKVNFVGEKKFIRQNVVCFPVRITTHLQDLLEIVIRGEEQKRSRTCRASELNAAVVLSVEKILKRPQLLKAFEISKNPNDGL